MIKIRDFTALKTATKFDLAVGINFMPSGPSTTSPNLDRGRFRGKLFQKMLASRVFAWISILMMTSLSYNAAVVDAEVDDREIVVASKFYCGSTIVVVEVPACKVSLVHS